MPSTQFKSAQKEKEKEKRKKKKTPPISPIFKRSEISPLNLEANPCISSALAFSNKQSFSLCILWLKMTFFDRDFEEQLKEDGNWEKPP